MSDTRRPVNPSPSGRLPSAGGGGVPSRGPSYGRNITSPFTIRNKSRGSTADKSQAQQQLISSPGPHHSPKSYGSGRILPMEDSLDKKFANLTVSYQKVLSNPQQGFRRLSPRSVLSSALSSPETPPDNSGVSQEDSGSARTVAAAVGKKSIKLVTTTEISKKIVEVSSSMDQFDKSVRGINETVQEAYRKSFQDMKNRAQGQVRLPSPPPNKTVDQAEAFLNSPRKSKNATDHRKHSKQKNRLAPSSESDSSEDDDDDDDDEDEEEEEDTTSGDSSEESDEDEEKVGQLKVSIRHHGVDSSKKLAPLPLRTQLQKPRLVNSHLPPKGREVGQGDRSKEQRRSLSPIMPNLPDKQFATMLGRREERVGRKLSTMKNELAQLNHKVEMDKRKAANLMMTNSNNSSSSGVAGGSQRGLMETSYQGRPMRLMKSFQDSKKNVSNEFNEFLQTTGGKTGGWERKDHNAFLKTFDVWGKHPVKLMEALKKELPNKKPKDIASHIKWFERFDELGKANKEDLHKWSQEKRKETELVFTMGSEPERAKLESDKRRREHLQMIREQERDKSKEKLAQWKRSQSVRSATSIRTTGGEAEVEDDSSGNKLDIPKMRQHILDITAKVHALDNPKREFRPPRPLPAKQGHPPAAVASTASRPQPGAGVTYSRSFTQIRPTASSRGGPLGEEEVGSRASVIQDDQRSTATSASLRSKTRLPEVEPEIRSRPNSRPSQLSRAAQFRERDSRLMDAKKKAVEIARERRKANLSQLTAEEIRRRIRSRQGPATILNPTKQSELRKSITHLERLEMLSKQDLAHLSSQSQQPTMNENRFEPSAFPPINSLPSKGVPSWRQPSSSGDFL